MLWEEVDMVGDNHQVANLEGRVHAACSVRYEECLNAQLVHDTNSESDLLHVIALIVVETSLHGQNVYATQFTEDECSGVSLYGGNGEVGNLTVGNLLFVSYLGS